MRNRIITAVKQRFSIRKLSIGAASVLLGTSLYFMGGDRPLLYTLILTYQGLKPAKQLSLNKKHQQKIRLIKMNYMILLQIKIMMTLL